MSVQLADPLLSPATPFSEPYTPEGGWTNGAGSPFAPAEFDTVASQYPGEAGAENLAGLIADTNPMQSPASMLFGPLGGILQYLSSMASQFMGNGNRSQQYFTNATGGSNGDPHLSFNGSTWNDMNNQTDLLDSNSIAGGFRVSTQTTAPNANGITYNQSATVHTNFGQTSVTLDNAGNATIAENGYSYPLQDGSNVNLGNGETVARNADGSVVVTVSNGQGGAITTTLSENGQGVDVNTNASNVDLGGALVGGDKPTLRRYASTP